MQRSKRNLAPAAEHAGNTGQGAKRRGGAEGNAAGHLPLEQVTHTHLHTHTYTHTPTHTHLHTHTYTHTHNIDTIFALRGFYFHGCT